MHMLASPKVWTVEEVLALPEDGRRYELVDGVLLVNGVAVPGGDLESLDPAMTPSPTWTHQDAVLELARRLAEYVDRHRIGRAMIAPADVPLQHGQLVQPDIFVVPLTAGGKRPKEWADAGRLLLAVEVLSPSTARSDKVRKRALYQRAGVPQYWIVDVDARIVERWTPDSDRAEVQATRIEWSPDGATEPLRLDLLEYFTSVTGAPAD
jgi:Uma2 family endonuclease